MVYSVFPYHDHVESIATFNRKCQYIFKK